MIISKGEIRVRFLNDNKLEFINYLGKSVNPFDVLDDLVASKKEIKYDNQICSCNKVDNKLYSTSVGYIIK